MHSHPKAIRGAVCLFIAVLLCAYVPAIVFAGQRAEVKGLRYWSSGEGYTRIVVDLTDNPEFSDNRIKNPDRIYVDLNGSFLPPNVEKNLSIDDRIIEGVRVGQFDTDTVRVVLDIKKLGKHEIFTLSGPPRVVIDVFSYGGKKIADEEPIIAQEKRLAEENARKVAEAIRLVEETKKLSEEKGLAKEKLTEERILAEEKTNARAEKLARVEKIAESKALGKKAIVASREGDVNDLRSSHVRRVVIDAGHGGNDPGAIGAGGVREKDVVLDIAKKVKRTLEAKGGYEVYLTRNKDKSLTLEGRTMVANEKGADLFISVHANAHKSRSVSGLETYFLNITNEKESLKVAARENKISVRRMQKDRSEKEVILASLQLDNNVHESRKLANLIQGEMVSVVDKRYPRVNDLGVKNALFYVLVGAKMPSALVEVAFITNPTEAKRLKSKAYREHLANGIAKGIGKYFDKQGPEQKIAMR
jgi:N-acetylmuramoyl-L-alanine amidase